MMGLFSLYRLLHPRTNNEKIWLIGEHRGFCLKDNGYFFYKYCRENHPEQQIFFAVRKNSPYFNELRNNDTNIVPFGSFRHIRLFFDSTLGFYTHAYSDLIYRKLFEVFGKNLNLIYLHHGVLGFKKFNKQYMRDKDLMDLFFAGNSLEETFILKDIKIPKSKIKVTGYPRYDHLRDRSRDVNPQIIYIPTHRNWITNRKQFVDFYQNIDTFISDHELDRILQQHSCILKIYLHYNMQQYMDIIRYENPRIQVVKHGDESPLDLICASNLMITDYSSVAWDFFFLNKPVIFYRFDIDMYDRDRGSYIPLQDDYIGPVAEKPDELICKIKKILSRDFKPDDKYIRLRDKIHPYNDDRSCSRIYNEILQHYKIQ